MQPTVWLQEVVFFALACACLIWAHWRTSRGAIARFPGPRPVGATFKIWLVVIWSVGLLLPLAALLVDGYLEGHVATRVALLPYFAMLALQIASELWCWKRLRSPIWVLVPCLYLPWRVWQCFRGLEIAQDGGTFTLFTLYTLAALWIINIGVHYTNIPRTLRWDYHAPDATFPALRDPRVFTAGAQQQELRGAQAREPHAAPPQSHGGG